MGGEAEALTCPFCDEGDFDRSGLAAHLRLFGCDECEAAMTEYRRERAARDQKHRDRLAALAPPTDTEEGSTP